ncbi:TPA: hypothetical protein ACNG53_001677 [Escherichia coli]
MSLNKKYILFVYGEGGHAAQMNRLAPIILNNLEDFEAITLSDSTKYPHWSCRHNKTIEFRDKYSWLSLLKNIGPLIIFKQTYSILRKKNIKVIVTTGPGSNAGSKISWNKSNLY